MSAYRHIDVSPIAGALGAEVHGVDLKSTQKVIWDEIRAVFLDRLVLFFPNQDLTASEMVSVGRQFGELTYYPFIEGLPEEPYVIPIIKEANERKNFGEGWHSDTTYSIRPPMATGLYAIEVPRTGGDTMFANMYLAYETLSEGMKNFLASLHAVNSTAERKGGGRAVGNSYKSLKLINLDRDLEGIHPVVRTHPETGRKALYVNELHTTRFVDWSRSESKSVLKFLYQHKCRPEFTCRYSWLPRTFAIWDNRAAQHFALNDYFGERRKMLRLSIAGEIPV